MISVSVVRMVRLRVESIVLMFSMMSGSEGEGTTR